MLPNDGVRFVTFTFDDGLVNGARQGSAILEEFGIEATFYVVTGWVRPRFLPIHDPSNRGLDHGSWRDWKNLVRRGHDIGSHTVNHLNASGKVLRRFPALLRWELRHSAYEIRRNLGRMPTSISMPWNATASRLEREVRRTYKAWPRGGDHFLTNDLHGLDLYKLRSWAPDAQLTADDIVDRIRSIPSNQWLILQFHSLDHEGYMPLTSEDLRKIARAIKETAKLSHITVDQMIRYKAEEGSDHTRAGYSQRKGRICIVTSEHLTTNPRAVKEADALYEAGYDVRVVACRWSDWASKQDEALLSKRSWRCDTVDFSPQVNRRLFWKSRVRYHLARQAWRIFGSRAFLVRAAGRVAPEVMKLVRRERADLVIGHNVGGIPAAVTAATKMGARGGFDGEDLYSKMTIQGNSRSLSDRIAASLEQTFMPECRFLSAAAPLIARDYTTTYKVKAPKVIHNVFPLADRPPTFRPSRENSAITLYWFSQTIGAHRGLEDIVRAIGLSGIDSIELHLRGRWQEGYEQQLRQCAHEAGVDQGKIIWHDFMSPDDMVRLSARYDVGLALEQRSSENRDICLTNKIFTYLLAGNAIIATATQGQNQLMVDLPGVGLCYKPGDLEQVALQLLQWYEHPDLLDKARRTAWRYGDKEYNWDIEKKKLLSAVELALESSPTR